MEDMKTIGVGRYWSKVHFRRLDDCWYWTTFKDPEQTSMCDTKSLKLSLGCQRDIPIIRIFP